MKIAIMTQPLGRNYGGIMQAWALQQVLKRMGHHPVTIDRQPRNASFAFRTAQIAYWYLQKLFGKRTAIVNVRRHYPEIFANTNNFVSENIVISEKIGGQIDLERHFESNIYDAVVVGSDQTWRPSYSPNILNEYLDFLSRSPVRKVAYATSFGVDAWEYTPSQTLLCRELIGAFDAVSVRENSGVLMCKEYLDAEAQLVLDPTFLLTKQDYESLIKGERKSRGVYTYILDDSVLKRRTISNVCDAIQKQPFTCQPKYKVGTKFGSSAVIDYVFPPVKIWLAGFRDADFVVTDSFHGCVFSILFNVPFVAVGNAQRGLSRFTSMLGRLNLENRLILDESDPVVQIVQQQVDWFLINETLSQRRKLSMDFLDNALS